MLLRKTSQSRSVCAKLVRPPQPKVRSVPRVIKKVSWTSEHDGAANASKQEWREDEGRYIFKLVLMMLLTLILPAILMLLYIFFNPEAFQYDITPEQDF